MSEILGSKSFAKASECKEVHTNLIIAVKFRVSLPTDTVLTSQIVLEDSQNVIHRPHGNF